MVSLHTLVDWEEPEKLVKAGVQGAKEGLELLLISFKNQVQVEVVQQDMQVLEATVAMGRQLILNNKVESAHTAVAQEETVNHSASDPMKGQAAVAAALEFTVSG
jgi:hypothetical protein